ncbi:MAG TPA: helix-turn-helix transcriptional regulator [Drouetiella sp.]
MKQNSNEDVQVILGAVLKRRRRNLGVTQQQLSDMSGVNRTFICNVENGQVNPSFSILLKLSKGLRVKPSTLLAWCERNGLLAPDSMQQA